MPKTVRYVGPTSGAFDLDVGEHGSFHFDPAAGIVSVTMNEDAAAIVGASQPDIFEITEAS